MIYHRKSFKKMYMSHTESHLSNFSPESFFFSLLLIVALAKLCGLEGKSCIFYLVRLDPKGEKKACEGRHL